MLKELIVTLCILHLNGALHIKMRDPACRFPFTYQGKQHNYCIESNGKYWCSLTKTYNNQWKYCGDNEEDEDDESNVINVSRGRHAIQSSTYVWYSPASNAVDGNKDQYFGHQSCSSTRKEQHAWWQVDLGHTIKLKRVVIYNRKNYGKRLSNFVILVTNNRHGNFEECASYPGVAQDNQVIDLECNANARYVKIKLMGNNYLTICEVEVYGVNWRDRHAKLLSWGHPTTQSSLYTAAAVSSRAVDGNLDQRFNYNVCTMTKKQQGAWWQVDLGQEAKLSHVVIYNVKGSYANRLSNFFLLISTSRHGPFNECAHYPGKTYSGQIIDLDCQGSARFVQIRLAGDNYLSLCEVKVYGDNGNRIKNKLISFGKRAIQSSTYSNGYASRAVDGDLKQRHNNYCQMTKKEQGAWWQVDLGKIYNIDHLVIYNANHYGNRLSNFIVLTSNDRHDYRFHECSHYAGKTHNRQVIWMDCHAKARYVRLKLAGNNYLNTCEVQVFGHRV